MEGVVWWKPFAACKRAEEEWVKRLVLPTFIWKQFLMVWRTSVDEGAAPFPWLRLPSVLEWRSTLLFWFWGVLLRASCDEQMHLIGQFYPANVQPFERDMEKVAKHSYRQQRQIEWRTYSYSFRGGWFVQWVQAYQSLWSMHQCAQLYHFQASKVHNEENGCQRLRPHPHRLHGTPNSLNMHLVEWIVEHSRS